MPASLLERMWREGPAAPIILFVEFNVWFQGKQGEKNLDSKVANVLISFICKKLFYKSQLYPLF